MASFVMIHGAWHGGWCFEPLRPLLENYGHCLIAPDLPGMGGTDAELAAVSLAGWGDYVANVCCEADAPVILCGHSRGGIVISEAAERVPDRVSALVYICAMMIPSGTSRAIWREDAVPNPGFAAIQQLHPSGHARIIDRTKAAPIFAHLSPPDLVKAALNRLVAEPDGPRTEALSLTAERYGTVSRHYIECLQDRTIPIDDQRRMQRVQPCVSVTSLDTDHSPYLSAPQALADALLVIARGVSN
jgi:pimeloyl-ACP methyl ester carboxylesterase